MAGAFAVATALAALFGAENTGTAFFFGQVAFAPTAVWVIAWRGRP